MKLKKILEEIEKDRPKVMIFPAALDAKEVSEIPPDMHKALSEAAIKKLKPPTD